MPKQNGQTGYDNIIASVEHDSLANEGEAPVVVAAPSSAKTATPQKNPSSPKRAAQAARSEGMQKNNNGNGRANSRAGSRGRAASAGRGKQGAWKEALGPSEKDVGWKGKGKRGPSTGLARWKQLVESKPAQSGKQAPPAKGAGQKAQELKAMLGVSASAPAPTPPSTAAGLKALLGVGGAPSNAGIPLSQVHDPPMMSQGPPQPPQPLSAADKLLAMMQSKQPQMQPGPMYPGPPQPTSFNFTYVEEGKEGPPQPQMQQQIMMPPPNYPMQYPPPQNAYNYGYPMPPPAHMMPPPPMQMHSPPPPQPSAGPSVEEFPPLGATAAPAKASAPKAEESKSAAPTAPAAIVPTVIKSKSRK